jgi:hypothetical protein
MFLFQSYARLDIPLPHRSDRRDFESLPIPEGDVGICDAQTTFRAQAIQDGNQLEKGVSEYGQLGS